MKKILVLAVCLVMIFQASGCGKDNEKKENSDTQSVSSQENVNAGENKDSEQDGIENGGDIDDEGNVIEGSGEKPAADNPADGGQTGNNADNPENQPEEFKLEYDGSGNITKESAILILQKYTASQLGLSEGVQHQLLFDENGAEVDGKKCYVIVAKIAGANTEGVFYVALDGSTAYKYDLENQKYIKLP